MVTVLSLTPGVILLWVLFTIAILVLIFANYIADEITKYKIKKIKGAENVPTKGKSSKKQSKKEAEKPNKYLVGTFSSTEEYEPNEVISYLELAKDFLSDITSINKSTLKDKINKLVKAYSSTDVISDKQDINNVNRNVIYFLGAFEDFKKTYATNEKIEKLTSEFIDASLLTLSDNVDKSLDIIDEIYERVAQINNQVFLRSTAAKTTTMESIKRPLTTDEEENKQ